MIHRVSRRRRPSTLSAMESLEARQLLAADLVAQWQANDLASTIEDGGPVEVWTDSIGQIAATSTGNPALNHAGLGGRPSIVFETSDGSDGFKVPSLESPMSQREDFSLAIAFATSSLDLQGGNDEWFKNSGLIDGNALGFGADWGLTMNSAGQLAAGLGAGFGRPTTTIYSQQSGLNDGQLHVAVLTKSGSDMSLYVDDSLSASTDQADTSARTIIDMAIGTTASGDIGFDGTIAEVRIFDGGLTPEEAAALHEELFSFYNNRPPVANADQYQFDEDASILTAFVNAGRGVLSNDTDPDGDPLSAILLRGPDHGTITLNADGSFLYDSDDNFFGADSFEYTARDFRDSAPVTVTIDVKAIYDPAVANDDSYKSFSGQVLETSAMDGLLANDLNPDGATLQVELVQNVTEGVLTLRADGGFRYDPQGFAGRMPFQYRIADGTGHSNTATATLIINTPPVAVDDTYTTAEDQPLVVSASLGLTANDIDVDRDPLRVELLANPQHGTVTLSEDGSFSYVPNVDYYGSDEFRYRVHDAEDRSGEGTVHVAVTPVNDAPRSEQDIYFARQGETVRVSVERGVLSNDSDTESDPLTARLVTAADQGTVDLSADGSFVYQAPDDFTGVATFRYVTNDGEADSAIATVEIAINSLEQQRQIVINELHVDPDVKVERVEFIELYNAGQSPVSLAGWTLRNAVDFTFPNDASIAPGGYLVVTQNPADYRDKFSLTALGPWQGKLNNDSDNVELWNASGDELDSVDYRLGFPWPTVGDEPGPSMQLIHPSLENDLGGHWRSAVPTPAAANRVLADNGPPAMRQLKHTPEQPKSGQPVTLVARVTDSDGVQSVVLEYQIVNPGDYISLTDARYDSEWTSLAMRDDGQNGDVAAGDSIYTVIIPAEVQAHRRLIRYRVTSTDTKGLSRTGPYEDDPQPNFAYFVYDGTPDWTGSSRPGVEPNVTYTGDVLNSLPTYQLITKRKSHEDAMFIPESDRRSGYGGSEYLWEGTMVFNGQVYDHIRFRARGGVWRYAMGKNMWKFDFNRGHEFQATDNYGNEYDTTWDRMNFSAIIQQGNFLHRGEQGLFESVGFKLFNLAGTESPNTNFVHFRIIENENENGTDQYSGDFRGMYLTIEQPDGNFLDEHKLPDGNFYKIEGNNPESTTNQGPDQVDDKSDARSFLRSFTGRNRPDEQWWRENLDLERYYGYQAISEAIHHYDTAFGKNFFYYNNPETGKWQIHPWDLDLTWADNMFGNANHEFNVQVAKNDDFNHYTNQANIDLRNRLNHEYQNRMREILDLLYNPEQTGMLIDEMSAFVYQPGETSFVDADRAM